MCLRPHFWGEIQRCEVKYLRQKPPTTQNYYFAFHPTNDHVDKVCDASWTFWGWEGFVFFLAHSNPANGNIFLSRDVYVHSGKSGHWGNLVKWSHKKLSQLKKPHAAAAAAAAKRLCFTKTEICKNRNLGSHKWLITIHPLLQLTQRVKFKRTFLISKIAFLQPSWKLL